jgi:y4mF family transcriptional regulator
MDFADAATAGIAAMARSIRARRKTLRLTQIELSRLAGCGPAFVYDVELGKTTLRLDMLLDLLAVLGLSLVLEEGKEALRVSADMVSASGLQTAARFEERSPELDGSSSQEQTLSRASVATTATVWRGETLAIRRASRCDER